MNDLMPLGSDVTKERNRNQLSHFRLINLPMKYDYAIYINFNIN
jgi:hypothetical protein